MWLIDLGWVNLAAKKIILHIVLVRGQSSHYSKCNSDFPSNFSWRGCLWLKRHLFAKTREIS